VDTEAVKSVCTATTGRLFLGGVAAGIATLSPVPLFIRRFGQCSHGEGGAAGPACRDDRPHPSIGVGVVVVSEACMSIVYEYSV
jgi:hypothetical protein